MNLQNTIIQCNKCVMDTTDPEIEFNESGVCNYCSSFEKMYPDFDKDKAVFDEQELLDKIVEIKKYGEGKEYDYRWFKRRS